MKKLFFSFLVLSFCFSSLNAEYFYLKSGETVQGKIVSEKDNLITVSVTGEGSAKTKKILISDIEEITATPRENLSDAVEKNETNPDEIKTKFTGDFRQENTQGSTISDNESGVLVFNVQETIIEKPKKQKKKNKQKAKEEAENSVQKEQPGQAKADDFQSATDDGFDAALFLLGKSDKPEVTASSQAQDVPSAPEPVVEPSKKEPLSDEEYYDASRYFIDEDVSDIKTYTKEDFVDNNNTEDTVSASENDFDLTSEGDSDLSLATEENEIKVASKKPSGETIISAALDMRGWHKFSGTLKINGVEYNGDKDENTDYGISLSLERYGYISRYAAVGLGAGLQFKRCLDESPGRFGFLPVYAAFKMRFIDEEDYYFYAVAHLGYNFLLANYKYLGKTTQEGGLYYAGGLGFSYNKYVFQVLYSQSRGFVEYLNNVAGDKIDRDIRYSKIGLYIGYSI